MFWAYDQNKNQIQASPGVRGICPLCSSEVVSKTGDIITWHFSHKSINNCDYWAENEGRWHLAWKSSVPPHMREVVIRRNVYDADHNLSEQAHRADVFNSRQCVIEFQHSPLNIQSIKERELFYENMIWIFDFTPARDRQGKLTGKRIRDHFSFRRDGDVHAFEWKFPRKSMLEITKPLFLDFGDNNIFYMRHKRLYRHIANRICMGVGEGNWIDKKSLIQLYLV